jgi:hypothetical protein
MDFYSQQEKIVPNQFFFALAAGIAAIAIGPAAHAQASTPARATAAQARPAAPAARTPKPIARADLVREHGADYKRLDANGDGAVIAAEIQAAQGRAQERAVAQFNQRREATFKQLDTNKDGQLSRAEFNAGAPAPRLRPPAPAIVIQRLDANKDQRVSEAEFSASTLTQFDRVDLNRDGIFSIDEQQKARATKK